MDAVTQQNAALVEQAAAASTAMREHAARLEQAVGAFQLAHDPAHGGQRPAARGRHAGMGAAMAAL
jgi:hypothetical protein